MTGETQRVTRAPVHYSRPIAHQSYTRLDSVTGTLS